jgi:hypothetical protein
MHKIRVLCYNCSMICPICNSESLVPIIYGLPTNELIEQAKQDRIVLGGTMYKEYTHYCQECQETYPFMETTN